MISSIPRFCWRTRSSNFDQPVRTIIELERSTNSFPNYSTLNTNLSATQINLLANLTAWSMSEADGANGVFSSLFTAAS